MKSSDIPESFFGTLGSMVFKEFALLLVPAPLISPPSLLELRMDKGRCWRRRSVNQLPL